MKVFNWSICLMTEGIICLHLNTCELPLGLNEKGGGYKHAFYICSWNIFINVVISCPLQIFTLKPVLKVYGETEVASKNSVH